MQRHSDRSRIDHVVCLASFKFGLPGLGVTTIAGAFARIPRHQSTQDPRQHIAGSRGCSPRRGSIDNHRALRVSDDGEAPLKQHSAVQLAGQTLGGGDAIRRFLWQPRSLGKPVKLPVMRGEQYGGVARTQSLQNVWVLG